MFDSANPPFLTLPVSALESEIFPNSEGYNTHTTPDGQIYISYRDGWTLPLTSKQKKSIHAEPLLLLRNSGHITSAGSSFNKGFAHQFCKLGGEELSDDLIKDIFPDRPNDKWMLAPDGAAVIWLQFSYKNQSLGALGHDMAKIYYGKLLIIELTIRKDYVPRLDKNADNPDIRSLQYRVEEKFLISQHWNTVDEDPEKHLSALLSTNSLTHYAPALKHAISRAVSYK